MMHGSVYLCLHKTNSRDRTDYHYKACNIIIVQGPLNPLLSTTPNGAEIGFVENQKILKVFFPKSGLLSLLINNDNAYLR